MNKIKLMKLTRSKVEVDAKNSSHKETKCKMCYFYWYRESANPFCECYQTELVTSGMAYKGYYCQFSLFSWKQFLTNGIRNPIFHLIICGELI